MFFIAGIIILILVYVGVGASYSFEFPLDYDIRKFFVIKFIREPVPELLAGDIRTERENKRI